MNTIAVNLQQLIAAHAEFKRVETRDLFYRVAMELIDLSVQAKTRVTVPEAIAVLLQTWNKAFFRFHKFDEGLYSEIKRIVDANWPLLQQFEKRSIADFGEQDSRSVKEIFRDFETVLGPVGAAKTIHLLAPRFFPLWDREIAKVYIGHLKRTGENSPNYVRFMVTTKEQVEQLSKEIDQLGETPAIDDNLLKAIDEFNYCTYTLPKEKLIRDKAAERRRSNFSHQIPKSPNP